MKNKRIEYPSEKPLILLIAQLVRKHKQFDYINGVLSSDAFANGVSIWNHWGELLVVEKHQQYGSGAKAGDMAKYESHKWRAGEVQFTTKKTEIVQEVEA